MEDKTDAKLFGEALDKLRFLRESFKAIGPVSDKPHMNLTISFYDGAATILGEIWDILYEIEPEWPDTKRGKEG